MAIRKRKGIRRPRKAAKKKTKRVARRKATKARRSTEPEELTEIERYHYKKTFKPENQES